MAHQTSPYLLMHAHTPVDWYPWGAEALEKARSEGKMIFLSIGYSSCYWCHVMQRESFMDEEIAAMLNTYFVAVKVDREERPDIDEIYMTAVQMYFRAVGSPRSGGWPLSVFLTPDAEPIAGGTYFPPRDRDGQVGFITVLRHLQSAWDEDPDALRRTAVELARLVKRQLEEQPKPEVALSAPLLDAVLEELARQYDPEYGGFGYSVVNPSYPKFPEPSNLMFLLDRARRGRDGGDGDDRPESMLVATLEKMAAGGIRDHVGGGFHRYSTDRYWQIPHFEKMLYDNAQLASVYSEAYLLTGREDFRVVTEEILQFALREMLSAEGAFHSAIDAETDAEEGAYYVWDVGELKSVLGAEPFQLFADAYGISGPGSFEGRHVPLLARPLGATAQGRGWSVAQLRRRLAAIRKKLLDVRSRRQRPLTDTKVLCAWNGLMIRGLADAGRALGEPQYLDHAETAARFVLDKLRAPDGRLLRTYAGDQAKLNGYLDDYAFLVDGLVALHQATGKRRWLQEADRLTQTQIELFWDEVAGGFFFTSDDHEALIARSKDPADSALPSGNALSVSNLVYLSGQTDKPEYLDRAEETLRAFAPLLERSPGAVPRMALSLAAFLDARG